MSRAVRFDRYGDVDVLEVVDVERPTPGPGEVLVRVMAAGINPGESSIRKGLLHDRWPATFPSGEGSDLAGQVEELGPGTVELAVGEDVLGHVDTRASHAELVVATEDDLVRRPPEVPWDVAGSLFVAGTTAYAAVRATGVGAGDTLVVSGAAGGVGSIAVQLAVDAGAAVVALASPGHHEWLARHGAKPVTYGDGVAQRIRAAAGGEVDAMVDTYGSGYVALAVEELGISPERIDTIIDREAAQRYGTRMDGSAAAATQAVLTELANLVAAGRLEVPIAATFPLDQVQAAYRELEGRHTLGKIVLHPQDHAEPV
jgi:NADPH:quinone reductase-like Zn-dependent oxidoreductase